MKLSDFPDAQDYLLLPDHVVYRVQRDQTRAGSVSSGAVLLPPRGLLKNRFDLANNEVGYFAESAVTAVYEALARRETTAVSLGLLKQRVLLELKVEGPLLLFDLRPEAHKWPVLQSLRFTVTQDIAVQVNLADYDGIAYRSSSNRVAIASRSLRNTASRCAGLQGSGPAGRGL